MPIYIYTEVLPKFLTATPKTLSKLPNYETLAPCCSLDLDLGSAAQLAALIGQLAEDSLLDTFDFKNVFSEYSFPWTSLHDCWVFGGNGHVHNGGVSIEIFKNDELICSSLLYKGYWSYGWHEETSVDGYCCQQHPDRTWCSRGMHFQSSTTN